MKLLGFIGGMNWQSTVEYYRTINKLTNDKLGNNHSARIIIYSVDFEEVLKLEMLNDWDSIKNKMTEIANNLEKAGAEALIICSNTMHLITEDLEKVSKIPIINVIDATAESIKNKDIESVGLLGTKFTMASGFYKERLIKKHGLKVLIPESSDIDTINNIIYKELAYGIINPNSKKELLRITNDLIIKGAQGVILGCTELPLILRQDEIDKPLFDTLEIHMKAALEYSLGANNKIY